MGFHHFMRSVSLLRNGLVKLLAILFHGLHEIFLQILQLGGLLIRKR